jgi:hypothetical protein
MPRVHEWFFEHYLGAPQRHQAEQQFVDPESRKPYQGPLEVALIKPDGTWVILDCQDPGGTGKQLLQDHCPHSVAWAILFPDGSWRGQAQDLEEGPVWFPVDSTKILPLREVSQGLLASLAKANSRLQALYDCPEKHLERELVIFDWAKGNTDNPAVSGILEQRLRDVILPLLDKVGHDKAREIWASRVPPTFLCPV